MAGDDEDSYDGEEPSVKLEQKENCEEVNGSSDTSEVGGRLASKSAEVKTTTWYSLLALFSPGRHSVHRLWHRVMQGVLCMFDVITVTWIL